MVPMSFHCAHLSLACFCRLEQKTEVKSLFATDFLGTKCGRIAIQQSMRGCFGKKNTKLSNDNVLKTKHWMALKSERKQDMQPLKTTPRFFKNYAWGRRKLRHMASKNNIQILKYSAWSKKVLLLVTNTQRPEFSL